MLLDLTTLPAFVLASAVVVLTPGVDVFLVLAAIWEVTIVLGAARIASGYSTPASRSRWMWSARRRS